MQPIFFFYKYIHHPIIKKQNPPFDSYNLTFLCCSKTIFYLSHFSFFLISIELLLQNNFDSLGPEELEFTFFFSSYF